MLAGPTWGPASCPTGTGRVSLYSSLSCTVQSPVVCDLVTCRGRLRLCSRISSGRMASARDMCTLPARLHTPAGCFGPRSLILRWPAVCALAASALDCARTCTCHGLRPRWPWAYPRCWLQTLCETLGWKPKLHLCCRVQSCHIAKATRSPHEQAGSLCYPRPGGTPPCQSRNCGGL